MPEGSQGHQTIESFLEEVRFMEAEGHCLGRLRKLEGEPLLTHMHT